MQTATTDVYPTRYAAFEGPRTFVEYTGDYAEHFREMAVYHDPRANPRFPHVTDGIYVEIRGRMDWSKKAPAGYVMDGQCSRPDFARTGLNR
jgi:hypothetical protein